MNGIKKCHCFLKNCHVYNLFLTVSVKNAFICHISLMYKSDIFFTIGIYFILKHTVNVSRTLTYLFVIHRARWILGKGKSKCILVMIHVGFVTKPMLLWFMRLTQKEALNLYLYWFNLYLSRLLISWFQMHF